MIRDILIMLSLFIGLLYSPRCLVAFFCAIIRGKTIDVRGNMMVTGLAWTIFFDGMFLFK